MHPRDKLQEDKMIFLETLPDLFVLCKGTDHFPGEDEMTREFRHFIQSRRVTLPLLFATTICLDIHRPMRNEVSQGFTDLKQACGVIKSTLDMHFKFHQKLRVENWPVQNDMFLRDIQERITDWVDRDCIADAWSRRSRGSVLPAEPPGRSHRLFWKYPLLCGGILYSVKVLVQEAGTMVADAWGSVRYACHLYNAVREEHFLTEKWDDMELALAVHEFDSFFLGSSPRNMDDYLRHFAIGMGVSVTAFAKDGARSLGNRGPPISRKGPRGLNQLCTVFRMFKDYYCHNQYRTTISAEDVSTIIRKRSSKFDDDDDDKERATKALQAGHGKLRAVKMFASLRLCLQEEMLELVFDHMYLHRTAWRLLRSTKDHLHDDLIRFYGPGALEKENQLPFLEGYVFMVATRIKEIAGLVKPQRNEEITSKLLESSAHEFRGMIGVGMGSLQTKLMRKIFA